MGGQPSSPGPPGGARLSDEEIRAIARAVRAAVARRPPDDPRADICSVRHELPPADEDRVIAELERNFGLN